MSLVARDVDAVVARLTALAAAAGPAGRTVLVAVDGAGGSGKSTLADRLAGHIRSCAVVRGDDFYRPMDAGTRLLLDAESGYRQYFDWQRLRAEVLDPLARGSSATFRRYDWKGGELGEAITVLAGSCVVIEGVYATRPELVPCYDLTVFVDTPREVCLRRLYDRGRDSGVWIERWRAAEDHYLERFRPGERADLVVRGT